MRFIMLKWFIIHQWREAVRSPIWHRKLVSNIFIGFLMFLIILNVLGIGLFLDKILTRLAPDNDPVRLFNSGLLLYFGFDLFMRFMLQKTPGLSIQPYLHLPIARSNMIHYLLSKSVWSLFNFLPLLVLIPFTLNATLAAHSALDAWTWVAAIFTIFLCSSYLVIYLKRQALVNPKVTGIFAVCLIGIFCR